MTGPLRLDINLHPGQVAIHNSTAKYVVAVCGRRFGKTTYAIARCLLEGLASETPEGRPLGPDSIVVYMAPTFEMAKGIVWPELKRLAAPVTKHIHENTGILTLINDVQIRLMGMDNPDRARGLKLRYAVLDEYAQMPAFAWNEIVRPALADVDGGALFIGTPKLKNHFYELYQAALLNPYDEDGDHVWDTFNFATKDNPTLTRKSVQRLYNDPHYDPLTKQQELEAKFIGGGQGVLDPAKFVITDERPEFYSCIVTVDLAGFTTERRAAVKRRRDSHVITVAYVHEGGWFIKEQQRGQWDAKETALRILIAATKNRAVKVGIEKGALMYAVKPYLDDYQKQRNRWINIVPLTHRNERKEDRIAWALEGPLAQGRIQLLGDPDKKWYEQRDKSAWIQQLCAEAEDFPGGNHDDCIDSLAYVAQLAGQVFAFNPRLLEPEPWAPEDEMVGL
jgi:hypothetical protein